MGPSQVEGTSAQASPGHPASVVAEGRKWNEDSHAVHAVKSTGCLLASSGLRDGMAGGNNPQERQQGRRHRFGMESGISLRAGSFPSLPGTQGELPAACSCCSSPKLGDQNLGASSTQPWCGPGHPGSAWSPRCASGTVVQGPGIKEGRARGPLSGRRDLGEHSAPAGWGTEDWGAWSASRTTQAMKRQWRLLQSGSAADSSRRRLGRKAAGAGSCRPLASSEAFARVQSQPGRLEKLRDSVLARETWMYWMEASGSLFFETSLVMSTGLPLPLLQSR